MSSLRGLPSLPLLLGLRIVEVGRCCVLWRFWDDVEVIKVDFMFGLLDGVLG
jgi:hypothetical protein